MQWPRARCILSPLPFRCILVVRFRFGNHPSTLHCSMFGQRQPGYEFLCGGYLGLRGWPIKSGSNKSTA